MQLLDQQTVLVRGYFPKIQKGRKSEESVVDSFAGHVFLPEDNWEEGIRKLDLNSISVGEKIRRVGSIVNLKHLREVFHADGFSFFIPTSSAIELQMLINETSNIYRVVR